MTPVERLLEDWNGLKEEVKKRLGCFELLGDTVGQTASSVKGISFEDLQITESRSNDPSVRAPISNPMTETSHTL